MSAWICSPKRGVQVKAVGFRSKWDLNAIDLEGMCWLHQPGKMIISADLYVWTSWDFETRTVKANLQSRRLQARQNTMLTFYWWSSICINYGENLSLCSIMYEDACSLGNIFNHSIPLWLTRINTGKCRYVQEEMPLPSYTPGFSSSPEILYGGFMLVGMATISLDSPSLLLF